eukprot:8324798-Pyramimonas_sp.AAC.1
MLAWAVTVHKSQGLTLAKVLFDAGPEEPKTSLGVFFVALTRVRHPKDLAFSPMPTLERTTDEIARKQNLHLRLEHEYYLRERAAFCAEDRPHLNPPPIKLAAFPIKWHPKLA